MFEMFQQGPGFSIRMLLDALRERDGHEHECLICVLLNLAFHLICLLLEISDLDESSCNTQPTFNCSLNQVRIPFT